MLTLASFSKEQGITIAGVCVLYDIFIVQQVSFYWYMCPSLEQAGWVDDSLAYTYMAETSIRKHSVQVTAYKAEDFQKKELCLILELSVLYQWEHYTFHLVLFD